MAGTHGLEFSQVTRRLKGRLETAGSVPTVHDPPLSTQFISRPAGEMTSIARPPIVSDDGIVNRKGAVDQHVLKEFIMESEQDLGEPVLQLISCQ